MLKIIAIGGGEIGRPGYPLETTKIDKEIINLTGKKHPKILFIPTASSDSENYCEIIKKYFGNRLKCKVSILYLIKNKIDVKKISKIILSSDIIYVGGGDTLKMMTIWRKIGVNKILLKAAKRGIVLAGISAGSICWFKNGNSDSRKFKNKNAKLIKVSGLNLINVLNCPHYDVELERKSILKQMMKKTPGVAIALDNCCAMKIVGNKYQIISSKSSAQAYRVYWHKGKYVEETIKKEKNLRLLEPLLIK